MKNRLALTLIATFASIQPTAINPSLIKQAAHRAHRNFFAFNKTGPVSLKQKCGIIKRTYFDLNGIKYPGTAKQWAIDKLHTKKNFLMAYGAATTAFLALVSQQKYDTTYFLLETLPKACKALINHDNYDDPNPFEAAEKAADEAALHL